MLPTLEQTLQKCLETLENKSLQKASLYALANGKRLRPLLTLATVASFSPTSLKKAWIPAASLEMIHTYSLIHDDLPCMDDDDERRGRKSLHRAFPEWLALLTGDFLLTFAFESVAKSTLLSARQKADLLLSLSVKSGSSGMIGGQIADLTFQKKKIGWPSIKKMHLMKTASLFITAVELGAIISNLSLPQRKILLCFGEKAGLAYQILDDLADHLEKGGSDQIKEKATVVSSLGKKRASQLAFQFLKESEDLLCGMQKADLLLSFVEWMQQRAESF